MGIDKGLKTANHCIVIHNNREARDFEEDHAHHLSECIASLLFDASTSDITLFVEGDLIHAHRAVLGSSCDYFRYCLGFWSPRFWMRVS